jgi:hypothetical protein
MAKRKSKPGSRPSPPHEARPGAAASDLELEFEVTLLRLFRSGGLSDQMTAVHDGSPSNVLRRLLTSAIGFARRQGPEVGSPASLFLMLGAVMRDDPEIGAHPSLGEYCEKMMYLGYAGEEGARKRYGDPKGPGVH